MPAVKHVHRLSPRTAGPDLLKLASEVRESFEPLPGVHDAWLAGIGMLVIGENVEMADRPPRNVAAVVRFAIASVDCGVPRP